MKKTMMFVSVCFLACHCVFGEDSGKSAKKGGENIWNVKSRLKINLHLQKNDIFILWLRRGKDKVKDGALSDKIITETSYTISFPVNESEREVTKLGTSSLLYHVVYACFDRGAYAENGTVHGHGDAAAARIPYEIEWKNRDKVKPIENKHEFSVRRDGAVTIYTVPMLFYDGELVVCEILVSHDEKAALEHIPEELRESVRNRIRWKENLFKKKKDGK